MNLGLTSQRVSRILLDFDLSIEFENGATIAFSELVVDDLVVDEDNQFEGLRQCATLLDSVCEAATYNDAGVLELLFGGATRVTARPRAEVESWEFCGSDGSTVLCGAGGEVETWPAPEQKPRATELVERTPAIGSTAVRITTGTAAAVEFSDGSVWRHDLPLDDGYLVLRETVAVHKDTDIGSAIELSSGYLLRRPVSRSSFD